MFFELICLLAILILLVYWYVTKNNDYWIKRNIPNEPPKIIFGNLFDAIKGTRNFGQIYEEIYRKHSKEKVVGIFNMMDPALMVRDPSLVNQILTTDFHKFSSNGVNVDEDLDPVLASNIFSQTGEKWKRNRQALSPAFSTNRVKSTFDRIQEIAEKMVKHLETHSENQEVKCSMSLYTSEIVASWGIGIDGHSFDTDDPILPKLGRLIFQPSLKMTLVITGFFFFPKLISFLKIKFIPDEVPNFFNRVVKDLINSRSNSDVQHKDFLQYFMDLKKKRSISKNADQDDVTDQDIMNGLVSFFIEGYETSSIILTFVLYHLTLDPDIQCQLRDEVDQLFMKGPPSYEAIIELPLLSRVFLETTRLYGAYSMNKVCTESCELNLDDGKTLKVEKGTTMVIPVRGLHTDSLFWQHPQRFDPSRWTEEYVKSRPKGTYTPFGDGPRICIGMKIANAIIKTAVVNIVRNFELLRTEKTSPMFVQDPNHFMTLMKGGVYIRFVKRNSMSF